MQSKERKKLKKHIKRCYAELDERQARKRKLDALLDDVQTRKNLMVGPIELNGTWLGLELTGCTHIRVRESGQSERLRIGLAM